MTELERILFVTGDDFATASEKQFVGFAQELLRRGHEVAFSVGGDLASASRERVDTVAGLVVRRHTYRRWRLSAADVEFARSFRPGVVHAISSRVPALPAARSLARAAGARLFVHFADDEWASERDLEWTGLKQRAILRARRHLWPLHPPLWWLSTPRTLRWTAREASGLDALTPTLAAEVEQRLGRPCSVVLPVTPKLSDAGGDGEPFDHGAGPIALFTGTVWPVYLPDFVLALQAIGLLHERGRPITLVHAGRFHPRLDPAALAHAAGVPEGALVLLGHLPFHRMDALLRSATVLLQSGPPNRFNRLRLPSKMQSYLESGVPTVTFATGFGELLEDRVEVLKTYGDEPSELADRIAELLDDPALAARVGAGGTVAAARLFDPVANVDALLRLYRAAA